MLDVTSPTLGLIGGRLRRARHDRGLTMEQVAAGTGIGQSSLSRLESGQREPSLAQLLTLAEAYAVSVGELLGERAAPRGAIVDPRSVPEREVNGLRFRVVDRGDAFAALAALLVTVPAGRGGDRNAEHAGEEFLLVRKGRLRLTLGTEVHELRAGMTAHFDASVPHRLDALGGRDAELLLVASRPGTRPPAAHLMGAA